MPTILQGRKRLVIEARTGENLMRALRQAGVPVASSCGGDGVCAKCRVHVIAGAKNLTTASPLELRLQERHGFGPTERVSCLARVRGDIAVDAEYW